MRTILIAAALTFIASGAPAPAEDNPACAKFQEPLEYNACLARQGPRAGATLAVPEPAGACAARDARRSLDARLRGPTANQGQGSDGVHDQVALERRAQINDRSGIRAAASSKLFSKLFQI